MTPFPLSHSSYGRREEKRAVTFWPTEEGKRMNSISATSISPSLEVDSTKKKSPALCSRGEKRKGEHFIRKGEEGL